MWTESGQYFPQDTSKYSQNLKLPGLELNTTFSTAGEKQKIIESLGEDAKAGMGSS